MLDAARQSAGSVGELPSWCGRIGFDVRRYLGRGESAARISPGSVMGGSGSLQQAAGGFVVAQPHIECDAQQKQQARGRGLKRNRLDHHFHTLLSRRGVSVGLSED